MDRCAVTGDGKRDLRRDRPLDAPGGRAVAAGCAAREPSPDEVAAAREEWDQLVESQPPQSREAVRRLGEGCRVAEVVEELGLSRKAVRGILGRIADATAHADRV